MRQGRPLLMVAIALNALCARAEMLPPRPDLNAAKPIATCKLQVLTSATQPANDRAAVQYSLQPTAEDSLANYARTPLGGWQMPADADRSDPWLRLLLVGPKRPVVIDLAVFVDGRSFREKREEWIDEVISAAKTQAASETVSGNKASQASGTNETDAASDGGLRAAEYDGAAKKPENGDAEQLPDVAAKSRQAPSMRERMMNYLSTNGDEVHRDEMHWLLAEWGAGPGVVVLAPSLSWQRAGLAPLLSYLDQDANGDLSASEISQADNLMKRADANGDDVVEISELRRRSDRPAASNRPTGHSLAVMLDANTDWESLAAELVHVYGGRSKDFAEASSAASIKERIARGDPTIAGTQMQELCSVPADVTLRVDFSTAKAEEIQSNPVSLLATVPELISNGEAAAVATADVISIAAGGDFVELSAAKLAGEGNDTSASQLAIGAVIDGNPLERLLDRDQDGRFTRRERQELGGLLVALDRNRDGQVAGEEIPVPIRLAVTLGPHVHRLLATSTGAARAIAPGEAASAAPDWFVSMDKNSDGDLARGEFLGTTEQFRQFDTDGDGLLGVAEAVKLNGTQ